MMKIKRRWLIFLIIVIVFFLVVSFLSFQKLPFTNDDLTGFDIYLHMHLDQCFRLHIYSFQDLKNSEIARTILDSNDQQIIDTILDSIKSSSQIKTKDYIISNLPDITHQIQFDIVDTPNILVDYSYKTNQIIVSYALVFTNINPNNSLYTKAIFIKLDDKFQKLIENLDKF